jgi:hypothetical protein
MASSVTPQAVVKLEPLPVYSKMDTASDVVKTLKKGDAVLVEWSIQGENNVDWCSIREPAQKTSLGYVLCECLNRPRPPESKAAPAPAAASEPATEAAPSDFWANTPLAAKIRRLCPEIDEGQLRYGWPLPEVASSIAMERCFAISEGRPGKKLTAEEIRAWQLKADRSGAQACWDRYLAIREKHHALALDKGARARSMDALSEWERDPCHQRVKALQDAIYLSPYMKVLPRAYDDVMSGRTPQVWP